MHCKTKGNCPFSGLFFDFRDILTSGGYLLKLALKDSQGSFRRNSSLPPFQWAPNDRAQYVCISAQFLAKREPGNFEPKNFIGALRKGPPFHGSRSSREITIQNASCQMDGHEVTGRWNCFFLQKMSGREVTGWQPASWPVFRGTLWPMDFWTPPRFLIHIRQKWRCIATSIRSMLGLFITSQGKSSLRPKASYGEKV